MGAQQEDPEGPGYDPEADEDEAPVRRVTVSPFALGQYPVTVQEYRRFVDAGGYEDPSLWVPQGWAWREKQGHGVPDSWGDQLRHPNRPAVGVSWYEADAFCRWSGGRLPTEAEWELATRGPEGRKYPWGEQEPNDRRANFDVSIGHPSPVGSYPAGATPEEVYDLAGNIWEWCGDYWDKHYPGEDESDPTGPVAGASRVLRGGSFDLHPWFLRAANRGVNLPGNRVVVVGFRLAWSSPPGAPTPG